MKLTTHCYALTGLANLPPWTVNAGFVVGETKTLVVDTGANWLAAQTIFGYATNMRPQNSLLAINTEQHLDHINGNGYFLEKGVDVYGHHKVARTPSDQADFVEDYNACITNAVRHRQREAEIFFAHTYIANPNQPIYSATTFDLGQVAAQILMTPGHTPSNISIYVPADGVLFCGDCIVADYLPNLESGGVTEWQEWLQSLDKLAAIQPRMIVPGHGDVLQGDKINQEIERTRRVLETAIQSGIAPTLAE